MKVVVTVDIHYGVLNNGTNPATVKNIIILKSDTQL